MREHEQDVLALCAERGVSYLAFNTIHGGPTNNPVVRQAISEAIDYSALDQSLEKGYASPVNSVATPLNIGYPKSLPDYKYNPAQAKAMIKQAGAAGQTVIMATSPTYDPTIIQAIQANLQAAGLNVKANILIGFPDEQRADLRETLRFILRMARLGVHDVSVWTFSPYPGSELFERLRGALSRVRQHRMRRVAQQRQPSFAPAGERCAVIHAPLEPAATRPADRRDDLSDQRVPAREVRGQRGWVAGRRPRLPDRGF